MPTVSAEHDARFVLTDSLAGELADRYGTPLYVIDEAHFRKRIRRFIKASRSVSARAEVVFASKANSSLAVLAIAHQEGCAIDVASEGELRAALAAGVPSGLCHLHGNNKSNQELTFGLVSDVGLVVVDHFSEIERIAAIGVRNSELLLRLAPAVDPVTHEKIATGQADTKFGFNIADGSAERAVLKAKELRLPLIGFHCHVGSQLLDPEAQRSGGALVAGFAVEMRQRHGFEAAIINVGGGLGVRYTGEDHPTEIEAYCRLVIEAVQSALSGSGLDPIIAQEPGRALIADSGVTLYRVGVVKTVPVSATSTRTYVCVDGGLSDNPRPALYGARYTVRRIGGEAGGARLVTVSGKHCETDRLFADVELPGVREGDLLQVLSTGAYNSSMASNYNRYPRPATALVKVGGDHTLIQRRDTWDEMLARELFTREIA